MTASDVPRSTITDVICWVDEDPTRAQAALEVERAGQKRSTLITQLEAIASQEDAVSETTEEDRPLPDQPQEAPSPLEDQPSQEDPSSPLEPATQRDDQSESDQSEDESREGQSSSP